jgi:hypothetical protein
MGRDGRYDRSPTELAFTSRREFRVHVRTLQQKFAEPKDPLACGVHRSAVPLVYKNVVHFSRAKIDP